MLFQYNFKRFNYSKIVNSWSKKLSQLSIQFFVYLYLQLNSIYKRCWVFVSEFFKEVAIGKLIFDDDGIGIMCWEVLGIRLVSFAFIGLPPSLTPWRYFRLAHGKTKIIACPGEELINLKIWICANRFFWFFWQWTWRSWSRFGHCFFLLLRLFYLDEFT